MELGNSNLGTKVSTLINKYKELSERAANLQEKIISLESANAEKSAKISDLETKITELEEEILTRSINDDEMIKQIEQVMGN